MTRQERAKIVAQELAKAYPDPQVPLLHQDPYTLLVAVLLSAQCTDARVNLVTPLLFALADTPQKMALTSPDQVREIIRPCGLSGRKSENIVELSKILVDLYEGQVPCRFDQLEALPGVGHKTASVVMATAFNQPAFPVDTHIYRSARRWGLSKGTNVKMVEDDLKKLYPESDWGILHLRMVLFSRKYCPSRGCGGECPICSQVNLM
ncbi:MAG: endonuclease III [Akkermansia sp.]